MTELDFTDKTLTDLVLFCDRSLLHFAFSQKPAYLANLIVGELGVLVRFACANSLSDEKSMFRVFPRCNVFQIPQSVVGLVTIPMVNDESFARRADKGQQYQSVNQVISPLPRASKIDRAVTSAVLIWFEQVILNSAVTLKAFYSTIVADLVQTFKAGDLFPDFKIFHAIFSSYREAILPHHTAENKG